MSDVVEICRAAKPDADEGWCQHILWGRTPFPFMRVTAQSLYRAAHRQARAERNGRILCDHCDAIAQPDAYICSKCEAALKPLPEHEDGS
jgi:uncharacterized paraquat-inducible protein A